MGEPATTAKVIFHTEKGPLDIELWAKECPINSRNFLANCALGKFNGQSFCTIIKNYIIQLGDDKDVIDQSKQIPDEFNQRIRFNKRGMLASANLNKKNTNGDEFFITLRPTPELDGKNTVFGKVVGNSVFTVVRIADCELEEGSQSRPLYPTKILRTEIVVPFFDNLPVEQPKENVIEKPAKKAKRKKKQKLIKLSFDDDEEDNDDHLGIPPKKVKMKSAHETLKDKLFSKKVKQVEIEKNDSIVDKKGDASIDIKSFKANTAVNSNNTISNSSPKTSNNLLDEINKLKASLSQNVKKSVDSKSSSISIVEMQRNEAKKNQIFSTNQQLREIQTLNFIDKFNKRITEAKNSEKSHSRISQGFGKDIASRNHELDEQEEESDDDGGLDFMSHRLQIPEEEAEDYGLQTIQ